MRPSGLSSTRPERTSLPRIPNSTHSRGGLLPSSNASEPRSKRLKRKWRRLQTLSPRARLLRAPALSRLPRPCNRRQRPYSRHLLRRQSPRARCCSRQRPGRDLPSEVGTQTGPDRAGPSANRSPYRSHGMREAKMRSTRSGRASGAIRKSPDSPLEGDGFELPVPRAMQARLEAKITGFGCVRRRLSAAAVGGHQLRRKAKSRNRTLIARGTGSFESISLQRRVRCELNLGEGGFADEITAAPAGGFATLDTTICPGRKGPSGNQRPDGRRERGRWRSKRSYAGSGRTPPTRPLGIRGRPRRRDPGASASSLR